MAALHRRPYVRAMAVALSAAGLILIAAVAAHATQRGWWDSTEFQVVNLDPVPATFTAHFLSLEGTPVYTITDTIPPLGTRFYRPEQMEPPLDPTFTGTLTIDSEQRVAATILHRDEEEGGALLDGNTTFDVASDPPQVAPLLSPKATAIISHTFFPVDLCTIIVMQNAAPAPVNTFTYIVDRLGNLLLNQPGTIMPGGAAILRVSQLAPVPEPRAGVVDATGPVQVTVLRSCLGGLVGAGSYTPLRGASPTWLVPHFLPASLGRGRASSLNLQNTVNVPVEVTVSCAGGISTTYTLPYNAGEQVPGPPCAVEGPLFIHSNGPIVASVLTEYGVFDQSPEPAGDYLYWAFSPQQATNAVALPVLLRDYEGWTTDGGIYVQNLGTGEARMHMRIVSVDGQVFFDHALIGPGMVWTPAAAAISYQHAAATVWADQPIMALVTMHKETMNKDDGLVDDWMGYRGVNFARPVRRIYVPVVLKAG